MSFTRSFNWDTATAQQRDMLRWLVWAVRASPFVTTVFVTATILWLGRSWLLAYPHIAIRTVEPNFGQIKDGLGKPSGLVGALLVVYFLPPLSSFIYESTTPMSIQNLPTILGLSLTVEMAISAFTFLWGLSILSRAYVKVIDGKVRLGMSDGTQA